MDTTNFEPAITHIPDNFVLAKPHMVVADDDSSDDIETVLVRLPAGVSLASLDGLEFDWPPTDGTVIPLVSSSSSEDALPKTSKKSKKSSAPKQDAPQLVFDSGMAPEAANMMVLVADSNKDSSSFRAHPITHVAAVAVPTSVPWTAIRDQGQRIHDQPYVPRAQPDMPYRAAFDAFASHAVPVDDMIVDAPLAASPATKRSAAADADEEVAKPKKAKRSKTDAGPAAEGGQEKEGAKKKKKKEKKNAKAE